MVGGEDVRERRADGISSNSPTMRQLFTSALLLLSTLAFGQNTIEWSKDYELQLSDFGSPATQIGGSNIYSLNTSASFDFAFYMSNAQFMFTKNFNDKVNCTFKRDAAVLVAPDSSTAMDLLLFARYDFDLAELYARKLRKKLYEEKGAFSDMNFFRPVFDQIQQEFAVRHTNAAKATDLGRKSEELFGLREEVLQEIVGLNAFCKECKPPKRKR